MSTKLKPIIKNISKFENKHIDTSLRNENQSPIHYKVKGQPLILSIRSRNKTWVFSGRIKNAMGQSESKNTTIGYVEGFAPSNPKKPILDIREALIKAIDIKDGTQVELKDEIFMEGVEGESLSDNIREFLEFKSPPLVSQSHHDSLRLYLNRFKKEIVQIKGKKAFKTKSITIGDYRNVRNIFKASTLSTNTPNDFQGAVNNFFNWCVEEGYLDANPIISLKKPFKIASASDRYLSRDEIAKIFKTIDEIDFPYNYIAPMCLLTGRRVSSVGKMKWNNIQWNDRIWNEQPDDNKIKGGINYQVPLSWLAMDYLKAIKDKQKELGWEGRTDYVFPKPERYPPQAPLSPSAEFTKLHEHCDITSKGNNKKGGLAIKKFTGIDDYKATYLRHTFRTHGTRLGIGDDVLDYVGGWIKSGNQGRIVYNNTNYNAEGMSFEGVDKLANFYMDKGEGNVVPLRNKDSKVLFETDIKLVPKLTNEAVLEFRENLIELGLPDKEISPLAIVSQVYLQDFQSMNIQGLLYHNLCYLKYMHTKSQEDFEEYVGSFQHEILVREYGDPSINKVFAWLQARFNTIIRIKTLSPEKFKVVRVDKDFELLKEAEKILYLEYHLDDFINKNRLKGESQKDSYVVNITKKEIQELTQSTIENKALRIQKKKYPELEPNIDDLEMEDYLESAQVELTKFKKDILDNQKDTKGLFLYHDERGLYSRMDVKVEMEDGVKVVGMHNTIKISDLMRDKAQ